MFAHAITQSEHKYLHEYDRRTNKLAFYLLVLLPLLGTGMFAFVTIFRMLPGHAFVDSVIVVTQLLFTLRVLFFSSQSVIREKRASAWGLILLTNISAQRLIVGKWLAVMQFMIQRYWLLLLARPILILPLVLDHELSLIMTVQIIAFIAIYPLFDMALTTAIGLLCSTLVSNGIFSVVFTLLLRILFVMVILLGYSNFAALGFTAGFAAAGDMMMAGYITPPFQILKPMLPLDLFSAWLALVWVGWAAGLVLLLAIFAASAQGVSLIYSAYFNKWLPLRGDGVSSLPAA